ncbi:MAG: hypothetical protein Q4Q03_06425 [Bowdeniella nasicola]|nr:hypothetical protein [Bowdeniella nasicola]
MSDNDEKQPQRDPETASPYRSEPASEKMPDFGADQRDDAAANAPLPATRNTRQRAEDDIFGGLPQTEQSAEGDQAPTWQPAPQPAADDETRFAAAKPAVLGDEPHDEEVSSAVPDTAETRASRHLADEDLREESDVDLDAEASPLTARRERREAEQDDDLESTQVRRSSLFSPTSETPTAQVTTPMADGSAVGGDALLNDTPATAHLPVNEPSYHDDDDLFAGEELEAPRSRVWAHVSSIFGILLLTPIAWYLIADAGARFTLPANAPWQSGQISIPAILELLAGLIVVVLMAILVRSSSVGAWITGVVVTAAGVMFVVTPELTQRLIDQPLAELSDLHTMGANIAHHFVADGSTGRLVAIGIALMLAGYISHSARRAGRREERLQAAYERRGKSR